MNKEQIEFLKALQKEMTTQDKFLQASPRYWVVGDYEWQPVPTGTGEVYTVFSFEVNENTSLTYEDMAFQLIELLEQGYDDEELEERLISDLKKVLEGKLHLEATVEETLDELGFDYSMHEESYVHFAQPNTLFLTKKEAEEHIQRNKHHYGADAHPYAMTAWRSPEVAKLLEILETVDWETSLH